MGISSGWRALRRRPATVEASGVLFATVERECTEALPFVRMQRLGDSWTDELRADRIAQVVDYLRKSFGHSAPIPATITLWAQSTCGRETTDQRLRNSTSKYGRRFLSTRQRLDLRHGWGCCLVFGRRKAGNRVLAKRNNCEICCRRSKHSRRALLYVASLLSPGTNRASNMVLPFQCEKGYAVAEGRQR
jgi:hypothetical protein